MKPGPFSHSTSIVTFQKDKLCSMPPQASFGNNTHLFTVFLQNYMKVSGWKSCPMSWDRTSIGCEGERPWIFQAQSRTQATGCDFYFALFLPGTGYLQSLQNGPIVHWLVMVHNVLGGHNCCTLMCGTKLLHISQSPPPPHQQPLPSPP